MGILILWKTLLSFLMSATALRYPSISPFQVHACTHTHTCTHVGAMIRWQFSFPYELEIMWWVFECMENTFIFYACMNTYGLWPSYSFTLEIIVANLQYFWGCEWFSNIFGFWFYICIKYYAFWWWWWWCLRKQKLCVKFIYWCAWRMKHPILSTHLWNHLWLAMLHHQLAFLQLLYILAIDTISFSYFL